MNIGMTFIHGDIAVMRHVRLGWFIRHTYILQEGMEG